MGKNELIWSAMGLEMSRDSIAQVRKSVYICAANMIVILGLKLMATVNMSIRKASTMRSRILN